MTPTFVPDPVKADGATPIPFDKNLSVPITTDIRHSLLHSGKQFSLSSVIQSFSSSGTQYIMLIAPSDKDCHVISSFESNVETNIRFYENPTTSGGTTLVPINNSRTIAPPPEMKAYLSPSVNNPGTLLFEHHFGNGTPQLGGKIGGQNEDEVVFKVNGTYLFALNNVSNVTAWIDYEFHWYEL